MFDAFDSFIPNTTIEKSECQSIRKFQRYPPAERFNRAVRDAGTEQKHCQSHHLQRNRKLSEGLFLSEFPLSRRI